LGLIPAASASARPQEQSLQAFLVDVTPQLLTAFTHTLLKTPHQKDFPALLGMQNEAVEKAWKYILTPRTASYLKEDGS
jgi:hypothetical protein